MRLFPPDAHCLVQIHAQIERLVKSSIRYSKFDHGFTQEQLSTLIEEAFWASLRSNEGRPTRVRLAVATPEQFPGATAFASPLRYEESEIVKLAQAVPLDGCLGVALANGTLQIWGFAGWRGPATVTIEITEPGTVRVDVGPFRPYAVLDGRTNDVIGATGWDLAYYLQHKLAKALPNDDVLETQAVWRECLALADLVRMILSDGHGGAVILVPSETGEWSESLKPFLYRLKTPDTTVRDVIRKELNDEDNKGKVVEEFLQAAPSDDRVIGAFYHALGAFLPRNDGGQRRAIEAIAPLAKVDGAVVMTRDMQLLGFGAKIEFRPDRDVPVCKFKPSPGDQEVIDSRLEDLGGMRHQSAARFIAANKGAVVIVVSQDRHVSVMNWEDALKSVCVVRNAEWWV
jgi:hypothetical protein